MPGTLRLHTQQTVIMANGGVTSAAIDIRGAQAGAWVTPATFEETTVKYQGGQGVGDTFVDIYDATSALVSSATVAAAHAVTFPSQVFAFPWIKIVGTVGGNVAADRTITVFLAA